MDINDPRDAAIAAAWSRLRNAICTVSVSQPDQIGAAVAEMMAAKEQMEDAIIRGFAPPHDPNNIAWRSN